jgi:hypothetical protein
VQAAVYVGLKIAKKFDAICPAVLMMKAVEDRL